MFYFLFVLVITVSSLASSYHVNSGDIYPNTLNFTSASARFQRQATSTGKKGGKCVLPPYPANGQYTVSGEDNAVPGGVYQYAYISVTCKPGFAAEKQSLYCFDGFWSDPIPQCLRLCQLKEHASVKYQCLTPGVGSGSRDCGPTEPKGTIVKPVCRAPDYYYPGILDHMTCDGYKWNYIAVCTPVTECGKVTPSDLLLVIGGDTAYKGELPWHVGIYRKTNSYEQICGGSLVSTTTIISAAHCFWSDRTKLLPASTFAVAAGKIHRQWNDKRDTDAQTSDVLDIKVSPYFQGAGTNYQDDIAVVFVATHFTYRTSVRPVCVDFEESFNNEQLSGSTLGKVGGWGLIGKNGLPSQILKAVDLPYINVDQCFKLIPQTFKEFITSDKMCAGYTNGTALCQGDSGGGLAFPATRRGVQRFYLRGVVSTAPKNADLCSANSLTAFTTIVKHEVFLRKYIYGSSQVYPTTSVGRNETCSPLLDITIQGRASRCLGAMPIVTTLDRRVGDSRADLIAPKTLLIIFANEWKCLDGTCIAKTHKCDSITDCNDGSDETDPECGDDQSKLQKGFCSLKADESIVYKCLVPGVKNGAATCGTQVASGTVVVPQCTSPGYISTSPLKDMYCDDGIWNYIAKCTAECGVTSPQGLTLVSDGRNAGTGEVPWYAGIYSKNTNPFRLACGGSLVSTSVVISAAHCFWKTGSLSPSSDYAVAVGKIYRLWQSFDDTSPQMADVAEIKIPRLFKTTNYQSDIALVIVTTPFKYSSSVRPICLNFDYNFYRGVLQKNNFGKIAGWEIPDKNGVLTNVLKLTELPFVSKDSCDIISQPSSRDYITNDKFCAGYEGGDAKCKGDGGAGIMFPAEVKGETRYYLRGVLSNARRNAYFCKLNTLALYTDITQFENFITTNVK